MTLRTSAIHVRVCVPTTASSAKRKRKEKKGGGGMPSSCSGSTQHVPYSYQSLMARTNQSISQSTNANNRSIPSTKPNRLLTITIVTITINDRAQRSGKMRTTIQLSDETRPDERLFFSGRCESSSRAVQVVQLSSLVPTLVPTLSSPISYPISHLLSNLRSPIHSRIQSDVKGPASLLLGCGPVAPVL